MTSKVKLWVKVARLRDQSEPSWPNAVPVSLEAGGAYRVGRTRRPHFLFSVALLAYELKMLQVTQGRSRSLEITPMSRACVSTYHYPL